MTTGKKPLLVRNAFPDIAYLVGKEDLLDLAQKASAESRIILERRQNRGNYAKAI